ncbi:Protein of unknown function [Lactobacillus delbrueckii subsp. bulgaricus]|nr:Protein of unknown function [Lactobacillus delbrueckii subsp. bulgaricus]
MVEKSPSTAYNLY